MESIRHVRINKIEWRLPDGTLHREDGPAIECYDGRTEWWINGKKHRLDGPALISSTTKIWYINGKCVTPKLHVWAEELGIDLNNLTEDDMNLIILKYGCP